MQITTKDISIIRRGVRRLIIRVKPTKKHKSKKVYNRQKNKQILLD